MKYISFLLASLKSSSLTKTITTKTPVSNIVLRACSLLEDLGYIQGFTLLKNNKIKITLKFHKNKSIIRSAALISKSSSRVYLNKKNLTGISLNTYSKKFSFIILTTSKSNQLLTDVDCILLGLGGEALFLIS